jgi:hypothetical protein
MRMHRALIRLLSFAGLCACASIALPARAQNAIEQFYRGKTITILIGHPAGGSYDLYARLAAAHLGRFIPGNPQVLVQSRRAAAAPARCSFFTPSGRETAHYWASLRKPSGSSNWRSPRSANDAIVATPKEIIDLAATAQK